MPHHIGSVEVEIDGKVQPDEKDDINDEENGSEDHDEEETPLETVAVQIGIFSYTVDVEWTKVEQ